MRDCFPSIVMCWLGAILAQSHLLSAMCKVKSGCSGRWKCWPVQKATGDHDILQCDSYLAISIYFVGKTLGGKFSQNTCFAVQQLFHYCFYWHFH